MNPFDQFDQGNPFDRFDQKAAPMKLGGDNFGDVLRGELKNADWGTRNIAGFGTALSDIYEGTKQFFGAGDKQQIEANKIIADEAPAGAMTGTMAATAIPFGLAGNSLRAAGAVGAGVGALQPVSGDQSASNVAKGKLLNAGLGAASGVAGQAIANKAGDLLTRKLADLQLKQSVNAPRDNLIREALDEGLSITPSAVNPSAKNVLVESIGGKIATADAISSKNAPLFDKLARRAVGLPPDAPLEEAALQAVRKQAYDTGYKPIADLQAVNWDPAFVKSIQNLSPKGGGGAVQNPAQAQIDEMITALSSRGQWTGEQLIRDIQALREMSKSNFKKDAIAGDTAAREMGRAQVAAADQLEQLAERNIIAQGGSGGAIQGLRDARKLIAKTHSLEDAIGEGGSVDINKLGQQLTRGKPLEGDLELLARFSKEFKSSAKPGAKVQGPGVSAFNAFGSTLLGGGGAAAFGPAGLAAAAIPFVARPAARWYAMSGRSQNALRDLYELGLSEAAIHRLLQNSATGGTVAGLEAFSQ